MTKRIIAIDPSAKMLYAAYRVLNALTTVAIPTQPENLDAWFRQMRWLGYRAVAYEDCYLSKNARTYAALYATLCRAKEAARKAGMATAIIPASEWQNALLISKGEKRIDTKRDVRKVRAMALAGYVLGYEPQTSDIADAVCIWHYVSTENPVTFHNLPSSTGDGDVHLKTTSKRPAKPSPVPKHR